MIWLFKILFIFAPCGEITSHMDSAQDNKIVVAVHGVGFSASEINHNTTHPHSQKDAGVLLRVSRKFLNSIIDTKLDKEFIFHQQLKHQYGNSCLYDWSYKQLERQTSYG